MPAIFFALISYVGWGAADIFGTKVTRRLGGFSTVLWTYILFLLIFSFYIPFAADDLRYMTIGLLLLNILLGIIGVVGDIAFYESLSAGSSPLVGAISASFPVVTILISIFFLNEVINSLQLSAILIIFIGLVLSVLNLKEIKRNRIILGQGVFLAIVAMVSWGIYYAFIKIIVKEVSWFWPIYITLTLFPLIYLFMKVRRIEFKRPVSKGIFLPLLVSVILIAVAEFSYNSAIDRGLVAVVAPIAGSYSTLFAPLAFLIFKDPITRQQIAGIITTLIGIVILVVFSV